jgi:hypothetical protein
VTPIDKRGIIRPNRDTLYSFAVFDFDAGPVTVMLHDAGKRFMSIRTMHCERDWLRVGGAMRKARFTEQ